MKERVAKINCGFEERGSSNFIKLVTNLESESCKWIKEINNKIELDILSSKAWFFNEPSLN